jgi:hypothetical protein
MGSLYKRGLRSEEKGLHGAKKGKGEEVVCAWGGLAEEEKKIQYNTISK